MEYIRVTNQMMINSSIANIQANKSQINTMDTQLSTQKKINKPTAIRALQILIHLLNVILL